MKRTLQTLLFALIAIMMPIGASAQIDDYITETPKWVNEQPQKVIINARLP